MSHARGRPIEVETDKYGRIRMDGALVNTDTDLKCYKGFEFKFTTACWAVTDEMVEATKRKFRRPGLMSNKEV